VSPGTSRTRTSPLLPTMADPDGVSPPRHQVTKSRSKIAPITVPMTTVPESDILPRKHEGHETNGCGIRHVRLTPFSCLRGHHFGSGAAALGQATQEQAARSDAGSDATTGSGKGYSVRTTFRTSPGLPSSVIGPRTKYTPGANDRTSFSPGFRSINFRPLTSSNE